MKTQKLYLSLLFLSFFTILNATNYISIGDGNWNDPANWSPMGVPNIGPSAPWPGDNVRIEHEITFTGDLTTSKKSSVQIKAGGQLIVTGILNINNTSASSFELEIGGMLTASSILINDSGADVMLDGTVTTDNLTLESGASVDIGGDITINNDLTASGGTTINFTGGMFTVVGNTSISGGAGINVGGGAALQLGNLSLDGGGNITGVNTGGSIGYNTISFAGGGSIQCVSNACQYTSGLPPNPLDLVTGAVFLPVSLINFNAEWQKGAVFVGWSTIEEYDNDYFLLEHSTDGQLFSKLITINGSVSSNEIQQYDFIHSKPSAGNNYYRLTQFDVDGTENVLGLRIVKHQFSLFENLNIAPNPITRGQQLFLQGDFNDLTNVNLILTNGQRISLSYSPVHGQLTLPASLVSGLYYLQLVSPTASKMLPLIIE